MAKFEITPEMMSVIAKDISQKIEEWNTAVNTVYSLHNELDAMFDGAANERLKLRMAEDKPKYEALTALMNEYVAAIVKAANDYATADVDAANAIKSIMGISKNPCTERVKSGIIEI